MQVKKKSELEFIALMAFLMANVAVAIDAVLPALKNIGLSIGVEDDVKLQLVVTSIFLGLGIGQLIFGTLSDSFGRKVMVYSGVGVFMIASLICVNAQSLEVLLIGRLLQGVGLSAPRTISIAIIRDTYSGDYMARIMSFVTVIFILVPMIAPMLGQFVLHHSSWEGIFYFHLLFSTLILIWFKFRQEETLAPENKKTFSFKLFFLGSREFFRHNQSVVYTLASGFITGSFFVYLSSSKQFFEKQFQITEEFVYIFAGLAFLIGLATFFNGSIVLKLGMRKLSTLAIYAFTIVSFIYCGLFFNSGNPSLTVLIFFFCIQFFSIGFIFGNIRSLAMQPIGHIAGIGSALNGFISTIMAVPIAILIGSFVQTTVLPLFLGFAICGSLTILLISFVKKSS